MLELANHPGQARHPVTGKPMFNADGTHVVHPAVENQRAIKLDGYVIAYVLPAGDKCRIAYLAMYEGKLPQSVKDEAIDLVGREFMPVDSVSEPIIKSEPEEPEDDE